MSDTTLRLSAGNAANVEDGLARFSAGVPKGLAGSFDDLVNLAADRSLEFAHPFLVDAIREARKAPFHAAGWTCAFADTGNPWRPALVATGPDAGGYVFSVTLDAKPTPEALAALDPELAQADDGKFNMSRLIRKMRLGDRIVSEGLLEGMPAPDTVSDVSDVSIHVFRRPGSGLRPLGNMFPEPLKETLAAVAAQSYSGGRVMRVSPDHIGSDGTPMLKGVRDSQCAVTAGALDAIGVLRAILTETVAPGRLSERNEEVGSRRLTTIAMKDWNAGLLEAAVAAVYRDGGMAGPATRAAAQGAWLHGVGVDLGGLVGHLDTCHEVLAREGHTAQDGEYDCNDGRTRMWVAAGGASEDAFATSQQGTYVIRRVRAGDGTELGLAHLGGKPRDAGAVDAALAPGAKGFRGRYAVSGDGKVTVLAAPDFSDRTVIGINDLSSMVASIACCCEEEYPPASATP